MPSGKSPGLKVDVFRNDEITLEDMAGYDKIILSPGPDLPEEAGLLLDIIKNVRPYKKHSGGLPWPPGDREAFGGKLHNMNHVYHGMATPVKTTQKKSYLFNGLPETFEAGRYHSWIVERKTCPTVLRSQAWTKKAGSCR
jgi:anthranilate synthase component II